MPSHFSWICLLFHVTYRFQPYDILKEKKHEHMKWCIITFLAFSFRQKIEGEKTTFSQPHENKMKFLLNLNTNIECKIIAVVKRDSAGLLWERISLFIERKKLVLTEKQRKNLYAGVTVRISHEIWYCNLEVLDILFILFSVWKNY